MQYCIIFVATQCHSPFFTHDISVQENPSAENPPPLREDEKWGARDAPASCRRGWTWLSDAAILSGWWFGTFFIFPYIGNSHPNCLILFKGVGILPTSNPVEDIASRRIYRYRLKMMRFLFVWGDLWHFCVFDFSAPKKNGGNLRCPSCIWVCLVWVISHNWIIGPPTIHIVEQSWMLKVISHLLCLLATKWLHSTFDFVVISLNKFEL